MRVLIPSALHAYTGQPWVSAEGATVGAVLADLERQFPGIRFRMVDEQGCIQFANDIDLDIEILPFRFGFGD